MGRGGAAAAAATTATAAATATAPSRLDAVLDFRVWKVSLETCAIGHVPMHLDAQIMVIDQARVRTDAVQTVQDTVSSQTATQTTEA